MPSHATLALITWSGMRGAVSLAAALAIPLTIDTGEPFPARDLILLLTFAVIFGTLVVQGLTLPAVIRLLELEDDGEDDARARRQADLAAAGAALRARRAVEEDLVLRRHGERIRGSYGFRRDRFSAWLDGGDDGSIESRSRDEKRRRELLNAERAAVQGCAGAASSRTIARRVERDLDLEDARLEI